MGGQDGFARDPLEYEIDSSTMMAGVKIKPSKKLGLGLSVSLNDSESSLEPFDLPADSYVATHPTMLYDFSQSHTYSNLDTSRLEAEAEAKYKFSEGFWLGVWYRHIDFEDDAPYLYDTSGTVKFITAALGWTF